MQEMRFLDDPRNVRKILRIFYICCAVLIALDLFDVLQIIAFKRPHSSAEGWFGFYSVYGFVGCFLLVLAAKVLRRVVMRKEDYYDE